MESFELILKAIASIPDLAIWAMVIFYGYQVLIAGSIYATIRFVTKTVVDGVVSYKKEPKVVVAKFNDILLHSAEARLTALLRSVRGKDSLYVRGSDVEELEKAWFEYQQRKAQKAP